MLQILNHVLSSQVLSLKKQCIICGKSFIKARTTWIPDWIKQKTCSSNCRKKRFAGDIARGQYIFGMKRQFICCLCGERIIGSKADLTAHKYERHSH